MENTPISFVVQSLIDSLPPEARHALQSAPWWMKVLVIREVQRMLWELLDLDGCNPAVQNHSPTVAHETRVIGVAQQGLLHGRPPDPSIFPLDLRPPSPTLAYCLLPNERVRWNGTVAVEPRLYRLLELVLKEGAGKSAEDFLVSYREVEDAIYDPNEDRPTCKTLMNMVGELNEALEPIAWPFDYCNKLGSVRRREGKKPGSVRRRV